MQMSESVITKRVGCSSILNLTPYLHIILFATLYQAILNIDPILIILFFFFFFFYKSSNDKNQYNAGPFSFSYDCNNRDPDLDLFSSDWKKEKQNSKISNPIS